MKSISRKDMIDALLYKQYDVLHRIKVMTQAITITFCLILFMAILNIMQTDVWIASAIIVFSIQFGLSMNTRDKMVNEYYKVKKERTALIEKEMRVRAMYNS